MYFSNQILKLHEFCGFPMVNMVGKEGGLETDRHTNSLLIDD